MRRIQYGIGLVVLLTGIAASILYTRDRDDTGRDVDTGGYPSRAQMQTFFPGLYDTPTPTPE